MAFDELQKKKSSGHGDDTDRSDAGYHALSVNGAEDYGVEVDLKVDTGKTTYSGKTLDEALRDSGSKLERCSPRRGVAESQDVKPRVSSPANDILSQGMSPEDNDSVSDGAKPKEDISLTNDSSYQKKEATVGKNVGDDGFCTKQCGKGQKVLTNGHKSKKMGASKKACEGYVEVCKTSTSAVTSLKDSSAGRSVDPPQSLEQLKDGIKGQIESGSSMREHSPNPLKAGSGVDAGKKSKDLLRMKKSFQVADNTEDSGVDPGKQAEEKPSGREKRARHGHGKPDSGANDVLKPAKKSKLGDMGDVATNGPHSRRIKSASPSPNLVDKKALKKSEFKGSTSSAKAESSLALKAPTGTFGSNVSGDETALPVTKRQRRAMEAVSESDTVPTDDKTERKSISVKNDVSCSSNDRVPGSLLHRKRRAVCLFDDDDEEPKTPVHGGSARNVTKIGDAHNDCSIDAQQVGVSIGCEDGHLKESSSELHNECLSPSEHQTDEKRPEKETATHFSHSPGKMDLEQSSSKEHWSTKETKSVLISPRKSPQSGPATKVVSEQHKMAKTLIKVSGTGTQKKVPSVPAKGSGVVSNSMNSSQNQVTIQRNLPSSGERSKTIPKSRIDDSTVLTESSVAYNSMLSERCDHFD